MKCPEDAPPCIKCAFEKVENGEEIPLVGCYALAYFLLKRGFSPSQVAEVFVSDAKNRRLIHYQARHIAESGGSAPRCKDLKRIGLCPVGGYCEDC